MTNFPEIRASVEAELGEHLSGQLLMDMFYTMALNNRDCVPDRVTLNQGYLDKLYELHPEHRNGRGRTRDLLLQLKVVSLRSGSLIMRHGAKPYLDQLEENIPTVTGLLTSINSDPVSFCLDPGGGVESEKDREVTVVPFDYRTLEPQIASIEVVGYGYEIIK